MSTLHADNQPSTWTARGNEPGWTLQFADGNATFVGDYGAITRQAPLPPPIDTDGIQMYRLPAMQIAVAPKICRDSMTGLPYPQTVTVTLTDQAPLNGCGGQPIDLLVGDEWRVEQLEGAALVADSAVTFHVDATGHVSGTSGCNRYFGQLTISGERLQMGPIAGTMMACPEALMAQEQRYHAALGAIDGFDIDDAGALRLLTAGAALIVARR